MVIHNDDYAFKSWDTVVPSSGPRGTQSELLIHIGARNANEAWNWSWGCQIVNDIDRYARNAYPRENDWARVRGSYYLSDVNKVGGYESVAEKNERERQRREAERQKRELERQQRQQRQRRR